MKKIIVAASLIFVFFLGACCSVTVADAEQVYPLKIWKQNENGMCNTWNIVDENTGVNYIVVTTWYANGNSGGRSCAITPRLNADGSLYVSH